MKVSEILKTIETRERLTTPQITTFKGNFAKKFNAESGFNAYSDELKGLFEALVEFVADVCLSEKFNLPNGGRWLTLSGASGCGKTMLAKEAFRFISKRTFRSAWLEGENWNSEFVTTYELAQAWRGGDWQTPRFRDAFFLVIDDLGAERDESGFVKDKMLELLNRRLGKWTILTTNLSLKNIAENYDARISSRLIRDENRVKRISAIDYALRALKESNYV